jgi:hypothetical protein
MMKNFTIKSILLLASVCITLTANAQTGSVTLKDGSETVVNTYSTIEAAYADIPATITQPYLIEFNSAYNGTSESFPITMSAKTGASSINTITIRPEAGNTTSSVNVNITTAVFQLANADYVIFDGRAGGTGNTINFEIINTNAASTTGFEMINGATNNVLRYVSVKRSGTASACISVSNSLSGAANGCSYNLVEYCKTEGNGSGILLKGTTTGQSLFNTVRNCVVSDFFSKGIDGGGSINEVVVEGCEVYQTITGNTTAVLGIAMTSSTILGSFIIRNNKIYGLNAGANGTTTALSILHNVAGTGYIYNNTIALYKDGFGCIGINMSTTTAANTVHIYHNTVSLSGISANGTGVMSSCLSKGASPNAQWFCKNNIMMNARTGGVSNKHVALNINDVSNLTMDYNCYYSSNICIRWNNTTDYTTLADFKVAVTTQEINSVSKTVSFASASDLHLSGGSASDAELLGTFITDVTSDIDGELRSVVNPYMGADESAAPLPVQLISFDAKKLEKQVLLRWSTASENKNSHFEIERSADALNFRNIGMVMGSGQSSSMVNYSITDEQPLSGTNYYRMKQVDLNGDFVYSKIIAVENTDERPAILSVNTHSNHVELYSTTDASAFVEIYDIQGRKIYTKEEWLSKGKNTITFTDAALPQGVYVLLFRNATEFLATQKFVQ